MENNMEANLPKRKKMNDFIKLFVGIAVLILALLLVKYALHAFHLV
jgi:hypothetical protein